MKGLSYSTGSPRSLSFDDAVLVTGGNEPFGLATVDTELLFDGKVIASSDEKKGLWVNSNRVLMFGDSPVGSVTPPTPPTPPDPIDPTKYWTPPTQQASVYKPWSYSELISQYDALVASAPSYITKHTYNKLAYGDYSMYYYVFAPQNYTKTIYIQAGVHGNEMDAKQTLLTICKILVYHYNETGYEPWANFRRDVRLIVCPCLSPYGHDNATMNVPYVPPEGMDGNTGGINLNRNYDYRHQFALDSVGCGGYHPWEYNEPQLPRDLVDEYGPWNIDYFLDLHDGGGVNEHYWINFGIDGDNRDIVLSLVRWLLQEHNINDEDAVVPDCCDNFTTGTAASWSAKTMGLMGSVNEWMGGLFGYSFDSAQMTHSLMVRGNLLLQAYINDIKGWRIKESVDASYFHFDYPMAMTRDGLEADGLGNKQGSITTYADIIARWDALVANSNGYITKSESLGESNEGNDVYSYTIGKGTKKVLFVGGVMRWAASNKITEFGIYLLAYYLNCSHIVNQSKFLKNLHDNYTIVVLPFIDIENGGNSAGKRERGLNCSYSNYAKWKIENDICQPTTFATNTAKDVPILLSFLASHQDARIIVSGGENTNSYAYEYPKYEHISSETHFIIPKNQDTDLSALVSHLEEDRGEEVGIDRTTGMTWADYAYDNYNIPCVYFDHHTSHKYDEVAAKLLSFNQASYNKFVSGMSRGRYMYGNYETGRRISEIVNLFLLYD